MVLFEAFCNFFVRKKKQERKKMFQNDLNECIFVYVHEKKVCILGGDGTVGMFGGLVSLFFFILHSYFGFIILSLFCKHET